MGVFPKLGVHIGVPILRIVIYWGLYGGPLFRKATKYRYGFRLLGSLGLRVCDFRVSGSGLQWAVFCFKRPWSSWG